VKGETWHFTVRPKDGTDYGELRTSSNVTIQNSPPSISNVTITPDPAYTNDTLTATPIGWFDADGDNATYLYQWQKYQSGSWENIPGATNQTLTPEHFVKGDQIKVLCTPFDGEDNGTVRDANITISNSPPVISEYSPSGNPTISVGESQVFNVTCSDLDGDALTVNWYVDESLVGTGDSYTFLAESSGTYIVRVVVTDGEGQETHEWTLTVTEP